ncbi:putative oligoketide cyclase/dehydratase or lipid transport protein YfjG [Paramagnetospirillum magnetotacticum MS-1]|uniref:Putative oligoketide cyclase/dehydratase or lipid transport protein YfjG n=1 Tax=Paramagnetospirillum magnetotacticum MS-1 TaxID=272627 RepID=A0A0C2U7P1_PARME|nr:type II toxin-antitoxin system RatA family toxin [Paramagnetospirillum magnetotacticum]KIL97487.1 putative oligoketide cyclase/dehydratase or lipid transport protein YfjG [Paramagnetospirillum magnetotacticum MS-1]
MHALTGGWGLDVPGHTPAELYALAADIESYPRFLPWCQKARVRSRDGDHLEVDNLFGLGPMQARFISQAHQEPPERLTITSQDGPFRRFRLIWAFSAQGDGCRVEAEYKMELRSPMLQSMAAMTLPAMEHKVVQNFRNRVREVYGR